MKTLITTLITAAFAVSAGVAQADIVHLDDVISSFSHCIGNDCVNGENFGFDTVRLKENNLRIHFDDTSNSSSFPRNDWRIVINDSSNGGGSYFAIEDSTTGRQPFRVEAGARSNALYVEDDGDIGIGTSTPAVDLHIQTGNTPTLRLAQDGTSGFTPQTWDLAGNETNFFIRDATNGSTLPIRLRPGAPTSAIDIASDGDVGMGTSSPSTLQDGTNASLHVRRTDGEASILVEEASGTAGVRGLMELVNNGQVQMYLRDSSQADGHRWIYSVASNFVISDTEAGSGGNSGSELTLTRNGDLTITGALITSGSCSVGCDLVFSPEYEHASIEQHAASMWTKQHLPAVGPTPENAPFNLTDKTAGILNELEMAHIYIEQLHKRLGNKEARLEQIHERLAQLESTLLSKSQP